MNLRPNRTDDVDVNLTPLIDVVFLLLIFFMVTTTFNREMELKIELPRASGEETKMEQKHIEITIDGQGRYFINRKQLINTQAETVRRALEKESGGDPSTILLISADGQAPHQSVITAMDMARQLGLVKMTFAVKRTAE